MNSVCILVRIHRIQDDLAVNLLGQRKLDQDPVNFGVGIHLLDEGQQFHLSCGCR